MTAVVFSLAFAFAAGVLLGGFGRKAAAGVVAMSALAFITVIVGVAEVAVWAEETADSRRHLRAIVLERGGSVTIPRLSKEAHHAYRITYEEAPGTVTVRVTKED